MEIKNLIILILLSTLTLYAHNVVGVDMSLEKIEDDKILVNAFFKKSKKTLEGNEVRLISMFDNRILDNGKLTSDGLVLNIPSESYWVYVLVRDNDIVKDGLPPTKGFDKKIKLKETAFVYTAFATIVFLLISFFISYKKTKKFRNSISKI